MSTITSTENKGQTLFDNFTTSPRKHDFRTARGKTYKSLNEDDNYVVTVGVCNVEREAWNYVTEQSEVRLIPYNALRVVLNAYASDVLDDCVSYLREVKPTRQVRDNQYASHTIPNTVRVALSRILVEDSLDTGWGEFDEYHAFCVLSVTIDSETNEPLVLTEDISRTHKWDSNPYIDINEAYGRDRDDWESILEYSYIKSEVESARKNLVEAKRRGVLIAECIEAGLASKSYGYDVALRSIDKFLHRLETPDTETSRHPISDAFTRAYDTSLASVARFYKGVAGKTTWEVSSSTFSVGRGGYYSSTKENDVPEFVSEVLAYALTVEWFLHDDWDRTPAEAKGEVLRRFNELFRGQYR